MKKIYTFSDYLIEKEKRERKYFKNYLKYAKIIKKVAENFLGEAKVFIFGSVLKKDELPRDIDILIISPKLKDFYKKTKLKIKIWRKIGYFSPFEIHLISPDEWKNWYQYFIKKKKKL